VRLLTNPLLLRMVLLLLSGLTAFGFGWFAIRRMKRNVTAESESLQHEPLAAEGLPVHAYHAVIQQLKQQKHELAAQQLSERRKARASETLSSTVLANLSSGVLILNTAGLVRQANAAARQLLGFASPVGLHLTDLFRAATLRAAPDGMGAGASIEQALAPALSGHGAVRSLLVNHATRDGETRVLEVTASSVLADDASFLGTALVLTDRTDIERIRHEQRVQREASAELVLGLKNSLETITGYAEQLACNKDPEQVRQLAGSIANEASHLERTIGGFLEGVRAATAGS
jgi:PAS domain-containing protein